MKEGKPQVIVGEGFDNSGKTTLLNRLSAEFGIPVEHSPGPKADMKAHLSDIIERGKTQSFILDRINIISEEVYGPVLRNGSKFDEDWQEWWDKFCDIRPIIIYCRPPIETIFSNLEEREQYEGVVEKRHKLQSRYDWVVNLIFETYRNDERVSLFLYDHTTDPTAGELIKDLRRVINERK